MSLITTNASTCISLYAVPGCAALKATEQSFRPHRFRALDAIFVWYETDSH